jgi:hypothetical protein
MRWTGTSPRAGLWHRRLAGSRCGWPVCTQPDAYRKAWPALRWQTREEPPIWSIVFQGDPSIRRHKRPFCAAPRAGSPRSSGGG